MRAGAWFAVLAFTATLAVYVDSIQPPRDWDHVYVPPKRPGVEEIEGISNLQGNAIATATEIAQTGSRWSKFKKFYGYFKAVASGFEPVRTFMQFVQYGDFIEAHRHEEIMKEFKKVDEKFEQMKRTVEYQADRTIHSILKAAHVDSIKHLDAAARAYDNYTNNVHKSHNERLLIKYYDESSGGDAIRPNVLGIKRFLKDTAKATADKNKNCGDILDYKAQITAMLYKPYRAYKLGCVLKQQKEGMPEEECEQAELPDLDGELYPEIDAAIVTCRGIENIKKYTEKWIDDNVEDEDGIHYTAEKLEKYLDETHPFMTYMVGVYDPLWGYDNHCTNANIIRFRPRKGDKNIVVHFLGICRGYPNCKEDRSVCDFLIQKRHDCDLTDPDDRKCGNAKGNYDRISTWMHQRSDVQSYGMTVLKYSATSSWKFGGSGKNNHCKFHVSSMKRKDWDNGCKGSDWGNGCNDNKAWMGNGYDFGYDQYTVWVRYIVK